MPEPAIGPESLEGGMRAAFGKPSPAPPPGVLDSLGAAVPRILLRDAPDDPTPLIRPRSEELNARQAGRYQIVGEIARGGVGVILKGRDVDLGRDVAMKLLREAHARSPQMVQRFIEEAQIGAQLQHPGIVPVYELGLHADARPFFTMKLVKGRTLSSLLEDRADPAKDRPRLLTIFEQVSQTMAYAHARGVVHRDLKPSNIMVGAFGEVQVVDWGFAKVFDHKGTAIHEPKPERTIIATVRAGQEGSQSLAGSVMGTPAYMPPEQALGHVATLDERADVFALGAILCEILTGKPPYTGEQSDVLVKASHGRLDDAYRRLDACGAQADLIALARRCLAPVPGDRPKDAYLVAQEISKALAAAEERARAAEREAAEARAKAEEEHARLAREKLAAEQARARAQEEKVRAEEEGVREEEARRKTAWERRARRRTVALAAVVLVALLAGSGVWFRKESRERAQAAESAAAVARAVEEATLLEGREEWTAAAAAAQRAVDLARASDALADEAETALVRIRAGEARAAAAAARAEKDRAMVARLEEIRAAESNGDPMATVAGYAQAFEDYGISIDTVDPAEAATRVRSSAVADELITCLYSWASRRREGLMVPAGDWKRVFDVARGADSDVRRLEAMDAAFAHDLPRLRELAAALDPETPPQMLGLVSDFLLTLGDQEASLELCRKGQLLHASDPSLNYRLGALHLRQKNPDWTEAVRFWTAALALRPESAELRSALGICLWMVGDRDGALDAWRDALAFPMAWPGIVMRFILAALEKRGELDAAIEGWREEASRNPEDRDIRFRLGHALLWKRDWSGALSQFREVVRLDPLYAPGHRALGSALSGAGQWEEAVAPIAEAVRLRPRDFALQSHLGSAYAASSRSWTEVWAAYRTLLPAALPPEQVSFCSAFSSGRRLRDPAAALAAAQEAVRLVPDSSMTHLNLGGRLWESGRIEEAASSLRQACRLPPPIWESHSGLGYLLGKLGDHEGAIDALREAIRLNPHAGKAHQTLGWVLGLMCSYNVSVRRSPSGAARRTG